MYYFVANFIAAPSALHKGFVISSNIYFGRFIFALCGAEIEIPSKISMPITAYMLISKFSLNRRNLTNIACQQYFIERNEINWLNKTMVVNRFS